MNIQNAIERSVKKGFLVLYNIELPTVEFQATRKEFDGDITVVVFPMLRFKKGNPVQIGEDLGKFLVENVTEITNYNVVKGFLNLVIDDSFYTNFFNQITNFSNILIKFIRECCYFTINECKAILKHYPIKDIHLASCYIFSNFSTPSLILKYLRFVIESFDGRIDYNNIVFYDKRYNEPLLGYYLLTFPITTDLEREYYYIMDKYVFNSKGKRLRKRMGSLNLDNLKITTCYRNMAQDLFSRYVI